MLEVDLDPIRLVAQVREGGRLWFRLRLLSSLDTLDGPDETLGTPQVRQDGDRVEIRCASSRWDERITVLDRYDDRLELRTTVRGTGRLLSAYLLGGHRPPSGFLPSGSALRTVYSPN